MPTNLPPPRKPFVLSTETVVPIGVIVAVISSAVYGSWFASQWSRDLETLTRRVDRVEVSAASAASTGATQTIMLERRLTRIEGMLDILVRRERGEGFPPLPRELNNP